VAYTLRVRLGWYEADSVSTAGMRMLLDGKTIAAGVDIENLEGIEVEIDAAVRNLRRLTTRLVNYKAYEVKKILRTHAIKLLARITELEAEEDKELGDLAPKAAIAPQLKRLSETA
jgi:hypothetical protein